MKEKKHIDELFKEGFKNFEASPSPKVWNKIQAKLSKDVGDKKVIPLWIKWGSIAALLALLLTVGNAVFNPSIEENPPAITEEQTDDNIHILNEKKDDKTDIESDKKNKTNAVVDNSSNSIEIKKDAISESNKNLSPSETVVASNEDLKKVKDNKYNIADATNETLIKKENSIPVIVEKEAISVESNKDNKKPNPSEIIKESDTKEAEVVITEGANKRSIYDAINEKEEKAVVTLNNDPDNRWDITPNVAPIYYSSLNGGSSIDPTFSDNNKSEDLNFSYGVYVNYNLNNRFSVRSGINNVNLSYATTDIELGIGSISSATQSINYNKVTNVIIPHDKGSLTPENNNGGFGEITLKSTNGEASLNQKISYFEVPLELRYALLNNKFGINLIGGVSTLFLNENEVSVEAGDFTEILGNANNLSSLSFTTNIGLGLNYSFSQKLMFIIEPMFKYQLNPYTDSSVDYKPYYVGIYSGLSFKF